MAICFELVVNFGDDTEAAQAAARVDPDPTAVRPDSAHRKVGWDPESLLDPAELGCEWSDELNDGSIHELVLCEKVYAELAPSTDYEVFRPGYRWIPYRGEEPSDLTADQRPITGEAPAFGRMGT